MKRFLLFAVVATLFAACSKDALDEQQGIQNIVDEAPATLTVGFEDDETRIQLNEAQKTVWTNGDLVSVFYRSDANQQWQYTGETGARTAELTRVDAGEATTKTTRVVVVYPYNEDYYLNTEFYEVQAFMPATQTYLKDSYGLDGNIMISQSTYNQIALKNVCGWLKLQLTGNGKQIKSITVRGNSGEQVAGEIYIDSATADAVLASDMGDVTEDEGENVAGGTGGNLVFEDTVLKEVTLNCLDGTSPTEKGVALGAEATSFYIALPPQTFTKGITVDITAIDGSAMTQSTDKEVVIERNHIKPMTAFGYNGIFKPANNEIYYTNGSTTEPTAPFRPQNFGDATIQSNTYDAEKECWVITFDKEVSEIGVNAFLSRTSLTSVTIPDSVTTIGDLAFYNCDSLTSVTVGNSVTTIGERAFNSCNSLQEFKGKFAADNGRCLIIDGVLNAFAIGCGVTQYTIHDSVTTIGDEAFQYCRSLTSVTIPDSVTTIGSHAFSGCDSLTSVTIPNSVATIGGGAFWQCGSLTSVTIGDSVMTIGNWAFSGCDSLKEFKGKFAADIGRCLIMDNAIIAYANASGTTYTIPDSVTKIGEMAFSHCYSLTSVTIPDSVTTIGSSAFECCYSLTSVTIGNSVTTIGNSAFCACESLTSVTIGNNVTTIGEQAFVACESLTSVTIPDSVTTIGDGAFNYCKSLTSVTIGNSVTTIGQLAFYECSSLTSVTIPDSVTTIGYRAFMYCNSLTSVTIGDSVTTIGEEAFFGCDSLTSVTIPNSVTTIGDSAFFGCDSLTSVTIGNNVTTIGDSAFWNCGLTSVTIPDSVTTIGAGAFEDCTSLTSVTIGNSVTTIGEEAFRLCKSLATVYCKPTTPPTGGIYMFDYNGAGRRIFVPASEDDSIINAYKKASGWSWYKDYIFEEE